MPRGKEKGEYVALDVYLKKSDATKVASQLKRRGRKARVVTTKHTKRSIYEVQLKE